MIIRWRCDDCLKEGEIETDTEDVWYVQHLVIAQHGDTVECDAFWARLFPIREGKMEDIIKTLTHLLKCDMTVGQELHLQKAIDILTAMEDYDMFLARVEIIQTVWAYYLASRQVGHTELMLHGILNYEGEAAIVVGAEAERDRFQHILNHDDRMVVPYNRLDTLVGRSLPLAWDNHAIIRIFSSMTIIESALRQVKRIVRGDYASN